METGGNMVSWILSGFKRFHGLPRLGFLLL